MTTMQREILTLLKSAVTGETLTLPEDFSLEAAEELILRQSLLPLAFQGAYNCGISPETEIMQRWQKKYFQILIHSQRQMRAVQQVCQAFEENGIDYMPLKGCNMKKLYPQPEMRMMGDADILIRVEQYAKIRPIMQALGFTEGKESFHELVWTRQDLELELHKCLFASVEKDFYAHFGNGWDLAGKENGYRYALRSEDEFIYLFVHMAKHYRSSGIGSRHLLDLYVYRRQYPNMDETEIEEKLRKLHLLEFYCNTRNLLNVWYSDGAPDDKTELMSTYILSGGSWGDFETRMYTDMVKKNQKTEKMENTRGYAIWRAIFPPKQKMQHCYKILLRKPWLYPLFWPVRWIQKGFSQPSVILQKFHMLGKMTDEKVRQRKEALNFVGLDFYDE